MVCCFDLAKDWLGEEEGARREGGGGGGVG